MDRLRKISGVVLLNRVVILFLVTLGIDSDNEKALFNNNFESH
jgi:hypothetical protein